MPDYNLINTDVLVIGAGGAGLRSAIEAYDDGAKVLIVSKTLLGKAHTVMAEGGIAAAVANVDSKDSWEVHFADTIVEGVYIGNWRMIEVLVKNAPSAVYELERYGALFDRTPEGKIMQRAFGAHTYRRLCHVGDKTGLELIRVLEDQVLHRKIEVLDEMIITKIIEHGGRVAGAVGLNFRTGEFTAINCKAMIIATGGCGRIYEVTSNSRETTGDGIALAFKVGATLQDMEMVQFHPTGMVYPPGVRGMLVTEGARGEGGILLNAKGERFMLKYSPRRKELDARDVVARAIFNEIEHGRGTEHGGVYLDVSHLSAEFVKKKLPAMYEQFKEFADIDITKERMEVAPTVHYFMGGIRVDPETGASELIGLFAAGEAAGGLHGANRLGGNSLADILVFGKRAGIAASKYAKGVDAQELNGTEARVEISRINGLIDNTNAGNPFAITKKLRDVMSEHLGIIRDGEEMQGALKEILALKGETAALKAGGGLKYNQGLIARIELENMLLVAECVARSAIERKESRGAHARRDYPKKESRWKRNILCKYKNNSIKLSTVNVKEMPPELEKLVAPEVYE